MVAIIIALISTVALVFVYACAVVSGRCSRYEESMREENGKN